jgi:hypothetical protein
VAIEKQEISRPGELFTDRPLRSGGAIKHGGGNTMPTWLIFALGTVCCWGAYGTAVHTSNALLGNPLKTALLVGIAYFFIAVLVPGLILKSKGADWSFINPAGSEPVAGKETGKAEQDSSKPALQEEGEAKQEEASRGEEVSYEH